MKAANWPGSSSRYEKAHETSIIMSPTSASNIISRVDLRARVAFLFAFNGAPLTASTNKKSLTYRLYQTEKPGNSSKI
jgi:hypothetical protein